jgi:inosine-uridine nucleoside N-ribohydrolase
MRKALFCLMAAGCLAQSEKVLLDTDGSYFNDDGAALVMLLNSPQRIDLQAMTVVAGNFWPAEGAPMMAHIMKLMHRDVPMSIGAQMPLVHNRAMAQMETWIEYQGAFAIPPKTIAGPTKAVDAMIDTIEKSPGKVTVLAIGPMTNLALALRLRPYLASKIERLVFMGGAVHSKKAEFNFWFDPEAAKIVLRSSIAKKVMFGLDICDRAPIDEAHARQITVKSPIGDLYRDDVRKNPAANAFAWDTLAAAFLLDPSFVTKRETGYLDVETTFGKSYGAVIPLDRTMAPEASPVEVMLDLDFERFFTLYKSLIH